MKTDENRHGSKGHGRAGWAWMSGVSLLGAVALWPGTVRAAPAPATSGASAPAKRASAGPGTAPSKRPSAVAAPRLRARVHAARPSVKSPANVVPKARAKAGKKNRAWSLNKPGSVVGFFPSFEIGFVAPMAHHITLGRDGSRVDYIREGGQDNLFFFWRIQAQLAFRQRHIVTALYQPLNLVSTDVNNRDITVSGLTFPAGTPMSFRYGFDFYRLTYHYVWGPWKGFSFGIGGGLQLRNATIDFTSADGTLSRTNRNIGPVPLIKIWQRYQPLDYFWMEFEFDGFWAGDKIVNGSTTKVEGAIVDMSLRVGFEITSFLDTYLNVRYLGGGAEGIGKPKEYSDGYTKNWIHTLIFSLGVRIK